MDFTTMGTIGSYLKQKNLNFAANYKLRTGQKVTDAKGNLNFAKIDKVETKEKSDEEVKAARLASIRQKMSNGRKLSDEELSYLREREPKTYKKAKHADEAREDLKGELKKAKTKQEARQAVTQAMIKASAQASADMAAYKSSNKSSSSAAASENSVNFNFGNGEVDGLSNALNSTVAENWSYEENQNYFDTNYSEEENFDDFDETQNNSAENFSNYAKTKTNSKTSANNPNQNIEETSPQDVMERFIMTIRALEAEWAEFTNSREYNELPNTQMEKDFLKEIGEENHRDYYRELKKPNARTLNAVAAYRTSMMFRESQFIVTDD